MPAAAARYRDAAAQPRNDVYFWLLMISLLAMVLAILLLLFDFSYYYGLSTTPPDAPTFQPVVAPSATPGKPAEEPAP